MENEEYLDIEDGLSVGTMKITNKYEIFTEEEIDNINNKIPELDERVGVVESEVVEINDTLHEVANKGTTTEVLERVTKAEIDRQIEDGTIANLTIANKSITNDKIANNTVNYMLLDDDIQRKASQLEIIDGDIPHENGFVTWYGQIQQIGTYAYKKIPITVGETIYVTSKCTGSSGSLAVFMNSNDVYLSDYKRVSEVGGKYYVDEPVTAPDNCSYVLICTNNPNEAPVRVKSNKFIDVVEIKRLLDDLDNRSKVLTRTNICEDIPYNLGFLTVDGYIQEFTTYRYKMFPVKENTTYYITTRCRKNSGTLAYFYDSTKAHLGGYKPNSLLVDNICDYVDEKVITPIQCSYMAVCTDNSETTPIILKEDIGDYADINEMNRLTSNLVCEELVESNSDIPHENGFVTWYGQIQQIGTYAYKKIPITVGETIYVTTNCIGSSGSLAVFMNSNDVYLSDYKRVSDVGGKYYVDEPVTAPDNCAYVLICTNDQVINPIKIKRSIEVTFKNKDFIDLKNTIIGSEGIVTQQTLDEVLFDKKQLEERLEGIDKLVEFDWKPLDKAYVVIVIDDGRHDLCKFLNIFKEYNMPLSCALMSSNLYSKQDDGRYLIDVALDIQTSGGEVLSHSTSGSVFTEETTDEDANQRLRDSKKILSEMGLVINGFVKPGGTGALARLDKFEHLVRKYYRYGYSSGYSTAYSSGRYDMSSLDAMMNRVNAAINSKNKITFYSHSFDGDEVTESNLRSLLEYIRDTDGVEVVTTKYLYDNFSSTKLENRILELEKKLT